MAACQFSSAREIFVHRSLNSFANKTSTLQCNSVEIYYEQNYLP